MFISYDEPLYRPPAEAYSFILQVTLGCSFNKCSFCSMYETKKFKIRSIDEILTDIKIYAKYNKSAKRVFLADGDALALPTKKLIEILNLLNEYFPKLRRVSIYASAFNLYDKTLEELKLLRSKKLSLIYYGIETGSYELLKKIKKPITNDKMISGLNKASNANMKISATVILGIGGKKYSKEHILHTSNIINNTNITYLSTLQLMLDNSSINGFYKGFDNDFEPLDDIEMLKEQKSFISSLNPKKAVIFRSNHASNSFALAGTLPKDKEKLIKELSLVIEAQKPIIPNFLRGF